MITKIHAQAKDLRPTLVFIDEADDVLRHRQANVAPDLVNRLLALMDGTEEKIRDVVFIAATNHPQEIDPALLRAGRFTEKVEFFPPPANQLVGVIATWMKGRPVAFERGLTASELAALFAGYTMADIEGMLQYAVNRAISRHKPGQPVVVGFGDVYVALDGVGSSAPTPE
jgi:transitional endoplasmic reticulum ATPase